MSATLFVNMWSLAICYRVCHIKHSNVTNIRFIVQSFSNLLQLVALYSSNFKQSPSFLSWTNKKVYMSFSFLVNHPSYFWILVASLKCHAFVNFFLSFLSSNKSKVKNSLCTRTLMRRVQRNCSQDFYISFFL